MVSQVNKTKLVRAAMDAWRFVGRNCTGPGAELILDQLEDALGIRPRPSGPAGAKAPGDLATVNLSELAAEAA